MNYLGFRNNKGIVIDATVSHDKVEVTYRIPSNATYCSTTGSKVPDTIEKKIYLINDGKLTLFKTIKGKMIPQKTIHEHIEWDD